MFGRNQRIPYLPAGYWGKIHYGYPLSLNSQGQEIIRQQPPAFHPSFQHLNWNHYQPNQFPYPVFQQGYQQYSPPNMNGQQPYYNPNVSPKSYSQSVFQNPLQPAEETYYPAQQTMSGYANMNPYPKQAFMAKPPSGFQSVMNSFKGQDGSLDLNKMVDTAGQMMNAVTQVSSMVKGLGGIFKA